MSGGPDVALQAVTQMPEEKHWSTLRARAALKGIHLIPSTADNGRPEFIATWHALTRAFGGLDELEAWLDRVEGKRA